MPRQLTSSRTFLAKKRLDQAVAQVRSSASSSETSFTIHYEPYQLDPMLPKSVDKQEWYLSNKHFGNQEAQATYQAYMASLFEPFGLSLRFDGTIGNTFQAHRVIQYFQEKEGSEVAGKIIDGVYQRYFTNAMHPAAEATLLESCIEAGVDQEEAKRVIGDESTGERAARDRLRTVAMDVDAVPVVMVEGKRRDVTLTGAKEVADYVKALETVIKESS